MHLSIVIPAYNEYERLSRSLEILSAHLARSGHRDAEVIVVDDGSADATADLVRDWSVRWPALTLVQLPKNQGKGAALRPGIPATHGDGVAVADAGLSAPIQPVRLPAHGLDECWIPS